MDKEVLLEMGLSEREIAVYTSLLRLGLTTTGKIVKKSKVPNAKIYEILDKLAEKGLVTHIFKGKIKHFQASSPKHLLDIIEDRKTILKETVNELETIRNMEICDYKLEVYEGIKAIKSAFFEMYNHIGKNAEYCVFPIGEELGTEKLIGFWKEVFYKRISINIKIKTLPNKNLKEIFKKHYINYKKFKVRYTDSKFPTGVFIFKDHILHVIWGDDPVAFLIKSKQNYDRWHMFFEEQWDRSHLN